MEPRDPNNPNFVRNILQQGEGVLRKKSPEEFQQFLLFAQNQRIKSRDFDRLLGAWANQAIKLNDATSLGKILGARLPDSQLSAPHDLGRIFDVAITKGSLKCLDVLVHEYPNGYLLESLGSLVGNGLVNSNDKNVFNHLLPHTAHTSQSGLYSNVGVHSLHFFCAHLEMTSLNTHSGLTQKICTHLNPLPSFFGFIRKSIPAPFSAPFSRETTELTDPVNQANFRCSPNQYPVMDFLWGHIQPWHIDQYPAQHKELEVAIQSSDMRHNFPISCAALDKVCLTESLGPASEKKIDSVRKF